MNVFVVSYYDWEFTNHFLLTHDKDYSLVEFEDLCKRVKVDARENCLDKIRAFNRTHSWDRDLKVWDDDITYELVRLLVEDYGFRRLDCSVFDVSNSKCKCLNEL